MDDHWTRRQFGALAGATVLVGQARAAVGLAGVRLRIEPVRHEGKRHDFRLLGSHPEGISCRLDVQSCVLRHGDDPLPALAWLDDAHPFSRLVRPPRAIDLSATERALAMLHLEPHTDRTDVSVHLEIVLFAPPDPRVVALDPFPLVRSQG